MNCFKCGRNGYEVRDMNGNLCPDCVHTGYAICKHCGHKVKYCPLPI